MLAASYAAVESGLIRVLIWTLVWSGNLPIR